MDDELSVLGQNQGRFWVSWGFQLPSTLLKLFERYTGPRSSDPTSVDLLFRAIGLRFGTLHDPPDYCPAELLPVGQTELDGVVCGCVMHDPRLLGEMPLAFFDPSIRRGDYLGVDTRRSLGTLLGMQLNQVCGQDCNQARILAEELGFDPDELPSEIPLGVRPRLPPGWKLAETADGLGVVAESRFFLPQQVYQTPIEDFAPLGIEESLRSAEEALSENAPATALWYVRNALVFVDRTDEQQQLVRLRNQAYHLLNRQVLAGPIPNPDKSI